MPNLLTTESPDIPSILLAEDSEDDAYFFQRALKKTGRPFKFLRAANGKLAVQLIAEMLGGDNQTEDGPDLIFLDLKMPVMSGFEVLEWIKDKHEARRLRIIVLSGSNDQADRARAESLGASEYLVKPITTQHLETYLKSLAENSLPLAAAKGAI